MRLRERALRGVRQRIRHAGYLRKWVVLGVLIGLIAGVGSIVFYTALGFSTSLFLGGLPGYVPPSPLGEAARPITAIARPWMLPLVVGAGGLLAGIIVYRLAPEAEGHGTDAAIDAYHRSPRQVRARIPLVKLVASAITIGSGGSGGREGPTAQIAAGFGSFLARLLDLDAHDARIAVAVGIGAGIGSIFRAPLGGAVLGAEILYREDIESDALLPSFIASIVGYSVFGAAVGFSPMFGDQASVAFTDPRQLGWYALLGLCCGGLGILYVDAFYGFSRWFRTWSLPREVRPAVAGVAVGLIGMILPGALGTGYGWLQAGLTPQGLQSIPIWMLLALPFAKILATSLSIGSGGSGGVFGPGMVIGGLAGAAIWQLASPVAPLLPASPAPFAIVAMMAFFGSIAHAPLAVMLMVAEMTGNLSMLAPAMVAVGLASLVVGDRTIYRGQLRSRLESPAHRFRAALPLLASLTARDAARMPPWTLRGDQTASTAIAHLAAARLPGAPVLDDRGHYLGRIELADLQAADPHAAIATLVGDDGPVVAGEEGLDTALGRLDDAHVSWLPVVSEGRLLGILSAHDVVEAYRSAVSGTVARLPSFAEHSTVVTVEVAPTARYAGRPVGAVLWPSNAFVMAIARGTDVIVPLGSTVLQPGDRVSVLVEPGGEDEVEQALGGARPGVVPVADANAVPPPIVGGEP